MNEIRPISETADSVTLSREDFEALREELEDARDRLLVLNDQLLDLKPDGDRYDLTLDETMRIIDGEHPIKVWREKRGMTLTELSDLLSIHDVELEGYEKWQPVPNLMLHNIASKLQTLVEQLVPPEVAP